MNLDIEAARHQMIEQLAVSSVARPVRRITANGNNKPSECVQEQATSGQSPTLRVLCRTLSQLEGAIRSGCNELFVDFQDIREYRTAVATVNEQGARIYLATPRIQKPGEAGIFRAMAKHGADGFLVRNLAGLAFCTEEDIPFVCDYSLNVQGGWYDAGDHGKYVVNGGISVYQLLNEFERTKVAATAKPDKLGDVISKEIAQWQRLVVELQIPRI